VPQRRAGPALGEQDGGEVQDDERVGQGSEDHGAPGARGAISRVGARRALIGLVVGAYAWWAVALAPFSRAATVAVLLAGGTAAAVGARRRRSGRPREDGKGLVAWAALAAAAAAVQLAAYLQHPRFDHPTISSLTNALLDSHPARAVAFVVWLAATVELARR
jgi:hypothetical protein